MCTNAGLFYRVDNCKIEEKYEDMKYELVAKMRIQLYQIKEMFIQ